MEQFGQNSEAILKEATEKVGGVTKTLFPDMPNPMEMMEELRDQKTSINEILATLKRIEDRLDQFNAEK